MSVEAEIKALVESSKIGKQLKEKLIAIGNKKDNEFSRFQAEMLKLKEDYNEKSKTIENNIDQIQKDEFSSKRIDNIENRITELQKSFSEFKSEFSSKFNKFETKFSKYADAMQKSEPTEIIRNISTKLNLLQKK